MDSQASIVTPLLSIRVQPDYGPGVIRIVESLRSIASVALWNRHGLDLFRNSLGSVNT